MYIDKIRINNFKSFAGEHVINFNELRGCWWMTGQIGSGKTTVGEAIIFGLFGTVGGKNNKDLITWGEKHSLVEVWCQARNNNIYIKRTNNSYGQSPLYVEVNGEPVDFTNKRDAQSQLEHDYLDATRTTMELLCIISFNNFKSLSTLNKNDTKQFLDYVLGLDILTTYIEACKEENSTIRGEWMQNKASITAIQSQIDRMLGMTFIDGDLEKEKAGIAHALRMIKEITELHQPIIKQYQDELKQKTIRLAEVKTLGVSKKKEIDFIKKGVCPTCGAPIDQSHLEVKEAERENLLKQYGEINGDISRINAIIIAEQDKSDKSIRAWENERLNHEKTIIQLQEQAKHERANKDEIEKLEKEVEELGVKSDELQKDYQEYETIIQYLQTTVREKVMESFIPTINARIQEIASSLRMPYVPEYDLSFKCYIKNGIQNQIPSSSLSTGQLKMVDTVIILAILSSIITKVHSNVIFLDELFSNLDYDTRSELLIVLKTILPPTSSVLIVSHQNMDTELIDGHIKMSLENVDDRLVTKMAIDKKS